MIIVEGCDNSGKSTLINQLSEDLKLLVVANRRRPTCTGDVVMWTCDAIRLGSRYPTIFDRWQPISEPIYGPICRGTMWPDSNTLKSLHSLTIGALVVYCRPPDHVILNFGDRPQMEGVIKNAKEIIKAYDLRMAMLPFPVIQYDYTQDDYKVLREAVSNHLKDQTC